MIKLVMFDLDDTLVDHKAGADSALHAITGVIVKLKYASREYDFSPFMCAYLKRNHNLWNDFVEGGIELACLLEKRFEYIYDWFDIKKNTGI